MCATQMVCLNSKYFLNVAVKIGFFFLIAQNSWHGADWSKHNYNQMKVNWNSKKLNEFCVHYYYYHFELSSHYTYILSLYRQFFFNNESLVWLLTYRHIYSSNFPISWFWNISRRQCCCVIGRQSCLIRVRRWNKWSLTSELKNEAYQGSSCCWPGYYARYLTSIQVNYRI